jgi:hypothetical protein
MANVFVVEYDEKIGGNVQRIRNKVEFGNFDGDVDEAQRAIDGLWPHNYPERKNVKVVEVVGAGQVVKVSLPRDEGPNAMIGRHAPVVRTDAPTVK